MAHPEWVQKLVTRLRYESVPLTAGEQNRLFSYLLEQVDRIMPSDNRMVHETETITLEAHRPTSQQPVALWNGEPVVGVAWGIRIPYEDNRLQQEQGGF